MEVRSSIPRTMEPRPLQSTCRRQKEVHIHILGPAHCMNVSDHEHVLDLRSSSGRSPCDTRQSQKDQIVSPPEPQFELRKAGENADFSLGPRDHGARAPHQVPVSDVLCTSSSGECTGPPSWCQTRFKLARPCPPSAPPSTPPLSWSTRHNVKQRKSCEHCRFRKKKCSGHTTCIRCSRVGIDCVYMPDLIAKRTTDCLLENPPPQPGSHFPHPRVPVSGTGCYNRQISHRGSGYPSHSLNVDPLEAATRLPEREMKRRRKAPNGSTKPHKRSRTGKDSTRPFVPDPPQSIALGDGLHATATILGPVSVELSNCFADSVFGTAAEDTGPVNTGSRCVNFGIPDQRIYVTSIPTRWDAFQPHEVFGDVGVGVAGVEAPDILGFNPFLSPPPSSLAVPVEIAEDPDPAEPWMADDWLAWYGPTLFLGR